MTASLGPHGGLRGGHAAVTAGYHLSKRHWNTVTLDGSVPDDEVLELIGHARESPVQARRGNDWLEVWSGGWLRAGLGPVAGEVGLAGQGGLAEDGGEFCCLGSLAFPFGLDGREY